MLRLNFNQTGFYTVITQQRRTTLNQPVKVDLTWLSYSNERPYAAGFFRISANANILDESAVFFVCPALVSSDDAKPLNLPLSPFWIASLIEAI